MRAFSPFLALRYLLTRRINLLGVLGVMFAVWAMLLVDAVFTGFVSQIRTDVRSSAVDLIVTDLPHDTAYPAVRAAIAAAGGDDVVALAPRLRHHGLLQPLRRGSDSPRESSQVDFDHGNSGFALLIGIDPTAEAEVSGLRDWIRGGPEKIAKWNHAVAPSPVLDEPAADRRARLLLPDEIEWRARAAAGLPVARRASDHVSSWPGMLLGSRRFTSPPFTFLKPGDPLDLLCASFSGGEGNAALHTHAMRVAFAGWIAIGNRFDDATVLLPIEALRTALGHDAADDGTIELITDVAVRVRDGVEGAALVPLQRRLQAAVQRVLGPGVPPCSVLDWQQQNPVFLSTVAHEQALMQFVMLVVMLVAAFVIYATLHMMVVQKVKDIGILAAVGGSPRAIGAVFLSCGLVVAVTGALLGVGAGVLSAAELNTVNDWLSSTFGVALFPPAVFDLREVPVRLEPAWAAGVAITAVLLALLIALVPARKAARLNPVEALSYE